MTTPKILIVVGTRPEAVKLAPVMLEFRNRGAGESTLLCATGQHRQMLDAALEVFGLTPDIDLNLMQPDQSLAGLTADLLRALDRTALQYQPTWIVTQGDTTTAMAASLIGYYRRIKVAHVEAGLRTYDRFRPFPEEINRRIADLTSDRHYAPTQVAADNLLREGVPSESILVTGNTVVDAVRYVAEAPYDWKKGPLRNIDSDQPIVLVTMHRRESFGGPMEEVLAALRTLAEEWASHGAQFVFPVHLNPHVRSAVQAELKSVGNFHLLEPLDYASMIQLMKRSRVVFTDSGGVQEEAPTFGPPVLVLRETTERPEGVTSGAAELVGLKRESILASGRRAWDTATNAGPADSVRVNPYGDGRAAIRIVDDLWDRL